MTDLFISYARADQAFVRALSAVLERRQRQAWVDWEGIPPSAEWMAEIEAAIDAADTFVFVISPDAMASSVCARELEHAVARSKRLVPVVRREADGEGVAATLARLNWVFLREQDDFDAGVDTLIDSQPTLPKPDRLLDTDLDHVKLHTRYLVRAAEWAHKSFDASFVLRGRDLISAEHWLSHSGSKEPRPTSLHNRYILDSRRVATRRQRIAAAAVAFGLLIATTLGLLALQQSAAKRQNQQRAIANQLVGASGLAREQREDGLQESVQLAAEAMRRLAALGEHSLAADQALRHGLALLPAPPAMVGLALRGETQAAAFSANGQFLALATSLGDIVVRDVAAGKPHGTWTMPAEGGNHVRAIAVDDAGARVAIWRYAGGSGRSRLSLWHVAQGSEVAACDRDGDFVGPDAGLDAAGRLWADGAVLRLSDCRDVSPWPPGAGTPRRIALSGDGRFMAATLRQRGERQQWLEIRDVDSGVEIARWRLDVPVKHLWFVDADRRLAGADYTGKRLFVWDIAAAAIVSSADMGESPLAINGDGSAVVTAGLDSSIAKLRNATTGAELLRLVQPRQVLAAAFSPDGNSLATLTADQLWRWPLGSDRDGVALGAGVARQPSGGAGPAALDERVKALGLQDLKDLKELTVLAAAPCPNAGRVAVTVGSSTRGGWRARTDILKMPGGERQATFDLLDTLGAGMRGLDDRAAAVLACSADGSLLALPARDAVVVHDFDRGGIVTRLPHPGLSAVAFAPGGGYAATAGRGPVRIWQLSSSAEVARLLDGAPVKTLAFSDDGRYLSMLGAAGARTFLWQPRHLVTEACGRLQSQLLPGRLRQLFPEADYVATCAAAR